MNRKAKPIMFTLLVLAQFFIFQKYPTLRLDIDFIYLIIFYLAVKSGYVKGLVSASLLGLVTDIMSEGILGVFSFSRTVAAFFVAEVSRFIDFRKNIFIFLLLFISLMLSNIIANLFFSMILKFKLTSQLILIQPFLTALSGMLIVATDKAKRMLDVY